jgi:hypothetical protein
MLMKTREMLVYFLMADALNSEHELRKAFHGGTASVVFVCNRATASRYLYEKR